MIVQEPLKVRDDPTRAIENRAMDLRESLSRAAILQEPSIRLASAQHDTRVIDQIDCCVAQHKSDRLDSSRSVAREMSATLIVPWHSARANG